MRIIGDTALHTFDVNGNVVKSASPDLLLLLQPDRTVSLIEFVEHVARCIPVNGRAIRSRKYNIFFQRGR